MDKKNDRIEKDDCLNEEALLDENPETENDANFDALLRLACAKSFSDEGRLLKEMPVPDDCLPSSRLKKKVERRLRILEREEKRRAKVEARQSCGERRSFVSFRTLRSVVYLTILMLLCLSILMVSAVAMNTCGYEILWSTGVTIENDLLQVPIPVSKARKMPSTIEHVYVPALEPSGCESETYSTSDSLRRTYYTEEGQTMAVFFQSTIEKDDFVVYSDVNVQVRDIFVNEYTGLLIQWAEDEMDLLWQDGYYAYRLVGFGLSESELMQIAQSVAPVD